MRRQGNVEAMRSMGMFGHVVTSFLQSRRRAGSIADSWDVKSAWLKQSEDGFVQAVKYGKPCQSKACGICTLFVLVVRVLVNTRFSLLTLCSGCYCMRIKRIPGQVTVHSRGFITS